MVYRTYKENLENSKKNLGFLKNKSFCYTLMKSNRPIIHDARYFYQKIPHSREFKLHDRHLTYSTLPFDVIKRDNLIATTNELLLSDKYRKFGFITAENHIIDLKKAGVARTEHLGLCSENLFGENIVYTPLYSYLTDKFVCVMANSTTEKYGLRFDNDFTAEFNNKSGYYGELLSLIDNKQEYLQEMTEHCYDQIIKSILISVFDFGDDDHFYNYYLCKENNSSKFQELFIYDKESTAFSLPVALGESLKDIKEEALCFNSYNDFCIRIRKRDENFTARFETLEVLFRDGALDKKYYDFLLKIANYNYDKGAKKIYEETGLKPLESQIDMFKFGGELAGMLHERLK